ncbi:MAG: DUF4167 domain-containing protein [Paracoccaceae bacterium]
MMRSAQKSNRSRGRGNRKSGGGGGNNINRVFDSAGPEGKVRGTPQQIIDKYLSLARDAQTSGDRVTAENFLQHAEHYQRIVITANQAQAEEQARRESQQGADNRSNNQGSEASDTTPNEQKSDAQPDPASSPQPEIGGMAMIETPGEATSDQLLVTPEADAPAKSRSNGANRRRPRKPAEPVAAPPAEPVAAAPAEPSGEAPTEAAEGS